MIKVCLTLVPCPQADWEGEQYRNFALDLFCRQSAKDFTKRYGWTDEMASADLIVVLEPNSFKTQEYQGVLRSIAAVEKYPARVFTINYDDAPLAFLPGIYAAMPGKRFEAGFTVAGGYLLNSPNHFVREAIEWPKVDPTYLFTFRGALSSPVRQKMQRNLSVIFPDARTARFTVIKAWFNHIEVEKREYVLEILRSKFVLCPRGQGTASHRLFEVMELGRVPVIIADDWVQPVGPRWEEFSIRIREADLKSIPAVLSKREPEFGVMAQKARENWERFYAPEIRLAWALDRLTELQRSLAKEPRDYRARWQCRHFNRGNVGPLWSRVWKRLGFR
jgi:hypothetical protein